MSFWDLVNTNWQKILGTLVTVISALQTAISTDMFTGLMSENSVKWLALITMLLGAAITGSAFSTSAKVKVAEAMKTAIEATPGEEA